MPATPVGRVGRITSAILENEIGMFVEIRDDTDGSTGGAYVFTWDASCSYDDWLERLQDVDAYMSESGWSVEWFDEMPKEAQLRRPRT